VDRETSSSFGEYFSARSLPDDVDVFNDVDDQCSPDPYGILSLFYFWSFVILCAMVMLNLVIAVILENFQSENFENDAGNEEDNADKVKVSHTQNASLLSLWCWSTG
jgi:hypothetical protein